ncbi:MAG: phosphoribosylamine--glycine ligase [Phycisphaerales bacterium JB037]
MADRPLNVLLIGGGGREHALALRIAESHRLGSLWTSHPGNPGLAELAKPADTVFDIRQIYRLQSWCDKNSIDLVVIGPEAPLADGFADALATPTRAVFGPTKAGAQLEADKAWAKQLMRNAAIPTPEARSFTRFEPARTYIESREHPVVVKASGLAAGKGVFVCDHMPEAIDAAESLLRGGKFGGAGSTIVIEERLAGPEVSVLALVDGRSILPMPPCRDHKRLGEGDTGPNTGGMGVVCPRGLIADDLAREIEREILIPAVDALRREDIEFRGVLYAGIMLTHAGPKVLEFNVRFGDPECQPLMALLEGDALDLFHKAATGRLDEADISWRDRDACTVVLASEGYPDKPVTGRPITGLADAAKLKDISIHHAGTARDAAGQLVTAGGRVLGVTALGTSPEEARRQAYDAVAKIRFDGMLFRRDIGASVPSPE